MAQELESWADDLDGWEPSSSEPDLPEREDVPAEGDEESQDATYEEQVAEAIDSWCSDVLSEAQDAISEYPDYQG